MPAPENLTPQTPGEPLTTITPLSTDASNAGAGDTSTGNENQTTQAQPPVFTAKHNGGGRWVVIGADGLKVGDFVGASKVEAEAEALRLSEGGVPLTLDPERLQDRATQAQPKTVSAAVKTINPATLKQPVLTPDGWLCPEPPVKE